MQPCWVEFLTDVITWHQTEPKAPILTIAIFVFLSLVVFRKRRERRENYRISDASASTSMPADQEKRSEEIENQEEARKKKEEKQKKKETRRARRKIRRERMWGWIRAPLNNGETLTKIGAVSFAAYLTIVMYHSENTAEVETLQWLMLVLLIVVALLVFIAMRVYARRRGGNVPENYIGCRVVADCKIDTIGGQGFIIYGTPGQEKRHLVRCIIEEGAEPIEAKEEAKVISKTAYGFVVRK